MKRQNNIQNPICKYRCTLPNDNEEPDLWALALKHRKRIEIHCWTYGKLVPSLTDPRFEYGLRVNTDDWDNVYRRLVNRPNNCLCTESYCWEMAKYIYHECDICLPQKLTLISKIFENVPDITKVIMYMYMSLDFK